MKHTDKKKLARKMMSNEEIANGVSKFDSKAWNERKEAKAKKVIHAYMSALGKKGIATTLAKDPQHLEKMRANSLATRRANKESKVL